jgi:SAM-dependent methyltransferase
VTPHETGSEAVATAPGSGDWNGFFDHLSDRSPLLRAQADIYVQTLSAVVGLSPSDRVLDFGCGFGLVTARLASRVEHVCWWDGAPNMRAATARATSGRDNVACCDLSAAASPAWSWTSPPFDLVLVNSVAQYMPREDLSAWLHRWRSMLAAGGRLVLSDLIPRGHRGWWDLADLLRLGARHGLPLRAARDALGGIGGYWRTRRAAPLEQIDADDLAQRAAGCGLAMSALPRNLTHFTRRWSAVLRPRSVEG